MNAILSSKPTKAGGSEGVGRWRSVLAWLGGLFGVAALGAVVTIGFIGRQPVAIDLPIGSRIAILPFIPPAGQGDAWQRWGLSTMVAEALAETSTLKVVAPERVRAAIQQRAIAVDQALERPRLRMLAAALGAEVVLDGALTRQDEKTLVLEFLLYRDGRSLVQQGQLRGSDALTLGAQLVESLALTLADGAQIVPFGRAFTNEPFFDRLYGAGIEAQAGAGASSETAALALPFFEIALRDRPAFLRAKARRIELDLMVGRSDQARAAAESLLQESVLQGEYELQVAAYRSLGRLAALRDDKVAAAEQFRLSFDAGVAQGDKVGQVLAVEELIRLASVQGERERAETLLVEKLALVQSLGDRLAESATLLELGSLALGQNQLDNAAQLLGDGIGVAREVGDEWSEQRLAIAVGDVAARRGDLEPAEKIWRGALDFYRRSGDPVRTLLVSRHLGDLLLRRAQYSEAEKFFEDAREQATVQNNDVALASSCLRLAWIKLRLSYPFQAREPLDCALARDQMIDDRPRLQKTLAWMAYEQGDFIHAATALGEVKRQSPESWSAEDQKFLDVFLAVRKTGLRQALPGEPPAPLAGG